MNKNKYISQPLAKEICEVAKDKCTGLPFSEVRWCIGGDKCEEEWTLIHKDDESASYKHFYPSYDLYELGLMLPSKIRKNIENIPDREDEVFRLAIYKNEKRECEIWYSVFYGGERYSLGGSQEDVNEVEARGKTYLYLLKNNLL